MRGQYKKWLVLGIVVAGFGLFTLFTAPKTDAAVTGNPQINFQGKLTNPDGTNVSDGTYSIRFRIYTDPTADAANTCSANSCKWEETQASVNVSAGIFQVALGSVNSTLATAVDFSQAGLYLGVKVGSDPEMTPRIQFTSAPYAFNADEIDGIDSSGFVQLGSGSVQNDATTNPSVFLNKTGASGNILQLQKGGANVLTVANSGATTLNNTLTVQSNTYTANQVFLNNGLSSPLPSLPGGYLPTLTIRNSQTNASRPLFFGYDDTTGNGFASYLTAGACGSYNTMCLDFGTGTTTMAALENSGTTLNLGGGDDGNFVNVQFKNTGSVIVGSAVADAAQVLLQVDSYSNLNETATCGTATNQGAMYYNTATGTMRACVNGNWEDMVSTGGLGLLAFGVVPDSSNAGSPGDLAGITQSNSPCKIYWTDATHVTVAPCYAYSGGRKITVASTLIATTAIPASDYVNICLNASGVPALVGTGTTTDAAATQPTWSANNPLLCLGTLQMSTTAGTITNGKIYDTRTFTTTDKTFATSNTAVNDGWVVIQSTANLITSSTAAAPVSGIRGVVIAYSGATSTTAANVILAVNGPQWVKAVGTSTAGQYATTSTTAGFTQSTATVSTTTIYSYLGVASRTIDTTCTSNATCQYSQFLNPLSLR